MSKKIILVVEDEEYLLDAIRAKLESRGFRVATAQTVAQAVKYLVEGDEVSAIWLDHYLVGGEDGLDLLVQMKEVEAWKDIPVFVVSNVAGEQEIESYMKFDVTKYYVKSEAQLTDIVEDISATVGE